VSHFVIVLLSAFAVAWPLAAAETNDLSAATNAPAPVVQSPEAVEQEYNRLLDADDEAAAEVDKWIQDNNAFLAQGAGVSRAALNRRIVERFEPVRKRYEEFLQRHPNHAKARVAYGSFLNDLQEEDAARQQWEKALALDPKNPAVYNNLANGFTHDGPITNAFIYYEKAITLNPLEPLYYHNLSDTVYAFRHDAQAYYGFTNDQQVYDKSLALSRQALKLDPQNFPYATDLAMNYYGIKPLRTDEALNAWTNALQLAHDEIEREGVYIHFARLKMAAGRFAEAHTHIDAVTNAMYDELKGRLVKSLEKQEAEAKAKQETEAKPKP
jgi:tetratricopeptide (TPR) repeat protein